MKGKPKLAIVKVTAFKAVLFINNNKYGYKLVVQWSLTTTVKQDHGEKWPFGSVGRFGRHHLRFLSS